MIPAERLAKMRLEHKLYLIITAGKKYKLPFRWTVLRKAALVDHITRERVNIDSVSHLLDIPSAEILDWWRIIDKHGVNGLKQRRLSTTTERIDS